MSSNFEMILEALKLFKEKEYDYMESKRTTINQVEYEISKYSL